MEGYKYIQVHFGDKIGGDQIGAVAYVQFMHILTSKFVTIEFFIKSHEGGASLHNTIPDTFDPREALVYIFLQFIELGAEVGFFFDLTNYNNVYIASKGIDFLTFDFSCKNSDFLNNFHDDKTYLKSLIYLELIGKMFFLNDINNNFENFGFLNLVNSYKDIRLIDFAINDGLMKENMLERFLNKDISLTNKTSLDDEIRVLFEVSSDEKKAYAKEIISSCFDSLVSEFNRAINFTREFIKTSDYQNKLLYDKDRRDFQNKMANFELYINLVARNFDIFKNGLNK